MRMGRGGRNAQTRAQAGTDALARVPKPNTKERAVLKALSNGPRSLNSLTDRHGYAVGSAWTKGLIRYNLNASPHMVELVEEPSESKPVVPSDA
jgi:hypothetical protein